MNKNSLWKWVLLVAIIAWSLALVTPFDKKVKYGLDLQGGASFTVQVDRNKVAELILEETPDLSEAALAKKVNENVKVAKDVALEVIRNRVDGLGIAEPEIYPQTDTDNIIIRLPGIDSENIQEATALIERAAFLEFRLVHPENDAWVAELMASRMAPPGFKIPDVANADYYIRDLAAEKVELNKLGNFGFRGKAQFMLMKDSLRDGSTIFRPM